MKPEVGSIDCENARSLFGWAISGRKGVGDELTFVVEEGGRGESVVFRVDDEKFIMLVSRNVEGGRGRTAEARSEVGEGVREGDREGDRTGAMLEGEGRSGVTGERGVAPPGERWADCVCLHRGGVGVAGMVGVGNIGEGNGTTTTDLIDGRAGIWGRGDIESLPVTENPLPCLFSQRSSSLGICACCYTEIPGAHLICGSGRRTTHRYGEGHWDENRGRRGSHSLNQGSTCNMASRLGHADNLYVEFASEREQQRLPEREVSAWQHGRPLTPWPGGKGR